MINKITNKDLIYDMDSGSSMDTFVCGKSIRAIQAGSWLVIAEGSILVECQWEPFVPEAK